MLKGHVNTLMLQLRLTKDSLSWRTGEICCSVTDYCFRKLEYYCSQVMTRWSKEQKIEQVCSGSKESGGGRSADSDWKTHNSLHDWGNSNTVVRIGPINSPSSMNWFPSGRLTKQAGSLTRTGLIITRLNNLNEKSLHHLVWSHVAEDAIAQSQLLTVMDHVDKNDFYDVLRLKWVLWVNSITDL